MSAVASFFRQLLVLIPVYLGSLFSGIGYSWLASYMLFFQSTENGSTPFTIQQCTLMALVLHIGRITATFINILVLGKLGRKTPLLIANSLFLISAGLVLVNRSYLTVAISRFINGIANGIQECFSVMYWGEIPSKNFRGMLCSSAIAIFSIGILGQYALGIYLSYDDGAIVRTSLAILLVLSTYCMVESPYHLKTTNPNEALKTISWLRAIKPKQAEKELEEIDATETNIREFFQHFKKPEMRKSFGIALSLGFISTSMTVLSSSFANFVIPQTEFLNSHQFAILLNIIPITMSFLSATTIERFGRRVWLSVGFSLGAFLNAVIALMYYLKEKSILKIANFSWIVFFIIGLFLIVYFLSISPSVNALRTELFPTSHKVFGISLTIVFNAISFSLGTVFFLRVVKIYGMYLNFLMYGVFCLLGLWLVHNCLPETKGKSLAEIQQALKNNQKTVS